MSTTATPPLSAKDRTAAVVALLDQATTPHERATVKRVALQARFLWHCRPCKKNQFLTTAACGCGGERPEGLV
ncbi:hypothetical protein [Streptomyces griseus]|uniref:hypothetical protein n=1 Tax=Streptomyces griseus TaxID=1911 RepID=UPI000A3618D8|nr:hypothetical protein [Streptomyces fimicarius]